MAQQITACCRDLIKIICCITNNFQNMKISIEKGNYDEFIMYFEKKKVRIQDYEEDTGNNPLHLSVKANRYEMVEYILNKLQRLEREDKNFDGDTALMLAVLYSDLKMVRLLVEKGEVDVNCKESEGFTPFMAACANGKIDIVEYFMNNRICNIYSKNQQGQTAIHRAAFYGEVKVIRILREKSKLSLSSRDSRGNTCLHFAAMRLNMTCFRYILKKLGDQGEVEMKKKNQEGLTPVQMLIKSFNMIKKDDRVITELEVVNYINDKNKPPPNLYESLKELKPNLFAKTDPQKEQLLGNRPGSQLIANKQMVSDNLDNQNQSKKNVQVSELFQEQEMQNINKSISQIGGGEQQQQIASTNYNQRLPPDQEINLLQSNLMPPLKSPIQGDNPNGLLNGLASTNFAQNEDNPIRDLKSPPNSDLEIKNLLFRRKNNNYSNVNLLPIQNQFAKKNI